MYSNPSTFHSRSSLPAFLFLPPPFSSHPSSHLPSTLLPLARAHHRPQDEVHQHRRRQRAREQRRAPAVVEAGLAADADAAGAPVERGDGVGDGGDGDEGEGGGGQAGDAVVAEVEEPDPEAAEEDGEVEPGEEGALVGEEDFGLDARRERDAFAWGEERLEGRGGGRRGVPGAVWRSGWLDMVGWKGEDVVGREKRS